MVDLVMVRYHDSVKLNSIFRAGHYRLTIIVSPYVLRDFLHKFENVEVRINDVQFTVVLNHKEIADLMVEKSCEHVYKMCDFVHDIQVGHG